MAKNKQFTERNSSFNFEKALNYLVVFFVFFLPIMYLPLGGDAFDAPKVAFTFVFTSILFGVLIFRERVRFDGIWVLFFSAALLGIVFSYFTETPYLSFFGTFNRRVGSLLVFVAVAAGFLVYQAGKRKLVLRAAVWSSALVAVFGILQKIIGTSGLETFEGRIYSTFGNPVFLSIFLVFSLSLTLENKHLNIYERYIPSVILVLAIAFTGSRAAFIVSVVILIAWLILKSGFKKRTLIFAILMMVLVSFFLIGFFERFAAFKADIEERAEFAKTAVVGTFENPITGKGWNSYERFFRMNNKDYKFLPSGKEVPDTSHSYLMDGLFSSGILFILLFLAGMFYLVEKSPLVGLSLFLSTLVAPFSSSLLIWFFVVAGISLKGEGKEIEIKGIPKYLFLAVVLVALVISLISAYRVVGADFYYSKAIDYKAGGNYEKAVSMLNKASGVSGYEPLIYEEMARQYIQLSTLYDSEVYLREAQKAADKVIQLNSYSFTGHFLKGQTHLIAGDRGNTGSYRKAIDEFKICVYLSPTDPVAYYNLGLSYAGSGNLNKSTSNFKKAVEIYSSYVDALYALGFAYEKEENYAESLKYYKQALKYSSREERPAILEAIERVEKENQK